MLYELTAEEIALRLIDELKPAQTLQKTDQQLIDWNKKDALRKMPIEIRPNQLVRAETIQQMRGTFTSMIGLVKEKAYKYEKNDVNTMSKILVSYASGLKERASQQYQQNRQKGEEFQLEADRGEQMMPSLLEKVCENNGTRSQNFSRPDEIMGNYKKSFAPFVSNSQNPQDRHANSKLIRNDRVAFDGRMRNIAAIIEKNKKTNHFKTQGTFGRTNSQAKRNPYMDVTDILKYTLGDKRQKQIGYKPSPVQNPFIRIPAKYSESLNDFYLQK